MKVPCAPFGKHGLFLELPIFLYFRNSLCCFNKSANSFIDWENFKMIFNDTNLSDKSHCKYYYSIINHNIAQWLISQTLHSDVLKLLFKDFIAKNSLICSATFICFTKYNITSEKRYRKSMKFNFISINSNFGKHDSEENKFSWIELNLQQD